MGGVTNAMDVDSLAVDCEEDAVDVALAAEEHFAEFEAEFGSIIGEGAALGNSFESIDTSHQPITPLCRRSDADAARDEGEQTIDVGVSSPVELDAVSHGSLRRQRWKIVFA